MTILTFILLGIAFGLPIIGVFTLILSSLKKSDKIHYGTKILHEERTKVYRRK